MTKNGDGERLAKLEVEIKNLQNGMDMSNKSMEGLHGKFDMLLNTLSTNYVAKDTFEEYKKNKWLERVVTVIISASITGLISFFIVQGGR